MAITEPNNTINSANDSGLSLSDGQSVNFNGAIESASDVDLIKLASLHKGNVVIFDIDARTNGSGLDSVLRVLDYNGNQKTYDDDDASALSPLELQTYDSYLEYTVSSSGDFYVGVSAFANFYYNPRIETTSEVDNFNSNYNLAISIFNGFVGTEAGDSLIGTTKSDYIRGLEGNDILIGNGQNDYLVGNGGKDLLKGGIGDDLLVGGVGVDVLKGGVGNDTLSGESGNDRLQGGGGADVFAIGLGFDRIIDFEDGSDLILLTDGISFESIPIAASASGETGTAISLGEQVIATLVGTDPSQINANDFVGT